MNSKNYISRITIRKPMSACGVASSLAFAPLRVAQALVEIARMPAEEDTPSKEKVSKHEKMSKQWSGVLYRRSIAVVRR